MHRLYEEAVQCPEAEVAFIERVYRQAYGRSPTTLREDFCGTANMSCTWVRHRAANRAVGVDLDRSVLAWAKANNVSSLRPQQKARLRLVRGNVVTATTGAADVVIALNFSYFVFKAREELRDYFRHARRHLGREGLFIIDCYGGYEAQDIVQERRRCAGFTYVWEHADYNPITSETTCHIHFKFRDGSMKRRAFTYDWRLWTIAELREVLVEAGFRESTVYWEGSTGHHGQGDGRFRPTVRGDVCAGWVAYIVARK